MNKISNLKAGLLRDKVNSSITLILRTYADFKRPCLLWSGGKDSMVLLDILRKNFPELPDIVCWREPWMPSKQRFVNRVIQEWGLAVFDYAPARVSLCKGNGRIDVLNHYQIIGDQEVTLARGTEPMSPFEPYLCGVKTFLSRPTGGFNAPWDMLLIGHKSCDEDPTSGRIPLGLDVKLHPGGASSIFPLRHWTDEDILDYTIAEGVPFDEERYDIVDGRLKSKPSLDSNPDYYRTCLKCCDPDEGEFVHCPRLDAQINNISRAVVWQQPAAEYCSLRTNQKEAQ